MRVFHWFSKLIRAVLPASAIVVVCHAAPAVRGSVSQNNGIYVYTYVLEVPPGNPSGVSALILVGVAQFVATVAQQTACADTKICGPKEGVVAPAGWSSVVDRDTTNSLIYVSSSVAPPGSTVQFTLLSASAPGNINWITADSSGQSATGSTTGPAGPPAVAKAKKPVRQH
jgi:hypothetical protein